VWGLSNRNDFELASDSPGIMRDLFGSAWSFVKKFLP
jgi:hypothetical protein